MSTTVRRQTDLSDGSPRPHEPLSGNRFGQAARRHLPLVHFAVDSALWVVAIPTGVFLRYDFDVDRVRQRDVLIAMLVAVVLQGAFGLLYGLYRRRWRYGSFDEVRVVALTALSVGLVMTVAWWQADTGDSRPIPRSVPLLATGVSLLGQIAIRSMWRLYVEHRNRPSGDHLERLVLVGAGEGAEQILRTLRASTESPYVPVAMVDDDHAKRNLRMSGVRVEGRVDDLVAVADRHRATAVLIAAPSAPSAFYRRVTSLAEEAGLAVLVLPPVDQLLGGVGVADIRPVNETDLLGRHPADIDPGRRLRVHHRSPGARHRGGRVDRVGDLPAAGALRTVGADHVGPRRERAPRHPAVDRGSGDARRPEPGARRHPRRRPRRRRVRRVPTRGGVPHRGPQAPAAAGDAPGRGLEDECARHADAARRGATPRRRPVRERQHRQGGRPDERARLDRSASPNG